MIPILSSARIFTLALFLFPVSAFALTIELLPATEFPTSFNGQQVVAVGRDGLFIDSDTNAPSIFQGNPDPQIAFQNYVDPANNFTFSGVTLEIDENSGNGTVSGTLFNNANSLDRYSLNMSLTGACRQSGTSCTSLISLPGFDIRGFLEDPTNGRNSNLGEGLDTGIQWSSVALSISNLSGGPTPEYTGVTDFVGWAMPPIHNNPVELEIWSNSPGPGNLYFTAWYQAFNSNFQRIGVGDTKSFGILQPATTEVPEPTSVLLFGLGMAGLASKRRRLGQTP